MSTATYTPGSLVRARGREWIVLTGSDAEVLRVRPISGSEDDQTLIHVGLETEPVTEATFPSPEPGQKASHDAALLLRDALLLSLRRGAGPFRSFGQISVEPRAYQLVPLLMAMKLDPVRLLIADDVGIGKTIEAGLIARELLDRGEIARTAVLCPPHLVDQWVSELVEHFHLRPVAVTASSAGRLERDLPPTTSIFTAHPHTVVSLDYIKSDARRAEFLRACPEFVIVDEAHTCCGAGRGRHQRYELLEALTDSPTRHFVMLTATPHSGDEAAFFRLLGLLDRDFRALEATAGGARTALRERLAQHFVQRRRPDIAEWKENDLFPRRETKEITYKLSGKWEKFFSSVLDYCAGIVQAAEGDERRQRLNFWATLALMRCVGSSPGAALQALRTQAGLDKLDAETMEARIFDGDADTLPDDDAEPGAATDDAALVGLLAQAEALIGQSGDPKLKVVLEQLDELVTQGFNPVVFCRYIATARYLRTHVAAKFKKAKVELATGELTSDERRKVVASFGEEESKSRILIATDCLSEGINLQEHFDAVVHYDLSWNPTRHEQREGRVDRYGQTAKIVRATLMYGVNNPVDGAVLEVILRKAAKIREELGVPVPVPDEGHSLTQALLKAVLLKRGLEVQQLQLFEQTWDETADRAKKNRTVFAQRRLKPEDVLPEWHKSLAAIGGAEQVHRFMSRSLARLGSGLVALKGGGFKAAIDALPDELRERLDAEGMRGNVAIDFTPRPRSGRRRIQRSHPLVAVVAENLLERTLGHESDTSDVSVLGRVGCWIAPAIRDRTVVVLLRLRHQLAQKGKRESILLVEEASALAWEANELREGTDALALLEPDPIADPPSHVRQREVGLALEKLSSRVSVIDAFAQRRAQALLSDHRRVRQAADARGAYTVKPLLPVDVIGIYVLLPQVD